MPGLRRLAGTLALISYLWMGALLYINVLPGAGGQWPPDFHLWGYDFAKAQAFVGDLRPEARATYGEILTLWDKVFILSLATWMAAMGWRGNGIRWFVLGLAALYAGIDLAENAAIHRFVFAPELTPHMVDSAHHLTMAKFASLYLCILVLIVHLRRTKGAST